MTKSFEEFDVHKKGIVLTKLIFQLLNEIFRKNLVLKTKCF
jgi:hypothetical protein